MAEKACLGRLFCIERTEDLTDTLKEAFSQDVPSIIECLVSYTANMDLTNYLKNLTM